MEVDEKGLALKECTVGALPSLFYVPNFITEAEQAQLLHRIYEVPGSKWKTLKNRRLQNWGGVVHERGLLPQALPPWLAEITQRICQQTGLFPSAINHVLINEYLPNQGIMPHQDGPAYFPVVAILSLESPVAIDFTPHPRLTQCMDKGNNNAVENSSSYSTPAEAVTDECSSRLICGQKDAPCSLLLMPCSLFIFKDQAYSDYLHGIDDSEWHKLDKIVNSFEDLKVQGQKFTCSPDDIQEINGRERNILHRTSRWAAAHSIHEAAVTRHPGGHAVTLLVSRQGFSSGCNACQGGHVVYALTTSKRLACLQNIPGVVELCAPQMR